MMARLAWVGLLLSCTGCLRVDMYAPHGADVYLISSEKPVQVKRTWRTWFVVWGLVPLDNTNTMPDSVIAREQLTEARGITVDTVPDAFLGFLYAVLIPIGLAHQSVTVEGNRAPPVPDGNAVPTSAPYVSSAPRTSGSPP